MQSDKSLRNTYREYTDPKESTDRQLRFQKDCTDSPMGVTEMALFYKYIRQCTCRCTHKCPYLTYTYTHVHTHPDTRINVHILCKCVFACVCMYMRTHAISIRRKNHAHIRMCISMQILVINKDIYTNAYADIT